MTFLVVFCFLLIISSIITTNNNSPHPTLLCFAFEVGSEYGSVVSYGSALDPKGFNRIFTTGIDTTGSSLMSSSSSAYSTDTHCYLSVGHVYGIDRTLFQSPPLCLDVIMFKTSNTINTNTNTATLADGLVTAMDGKEQPILYELLLNSQQKQLDQPFLLPNGHFPAAMAADNQYNNNNNANSNNPTVNSNAGVYVALHPTNGVVNGMLSDSNSNRVDPKSTRDYFRHFTRPQYTTTERIGDDGYSPIIYKYNIETRQEEWQLLFNTTDGKTLITGMGVVPDTNRLVVFGSTTGYGMTVGAGAKTNGQNWNGFMTWVDLSSGTIDLSNYRSETHNSHGTPIRSQRNQNDFVLGSCMDGDKAFVVGSTTGKFEGTIGGGGFVLKLDTDRFDPTWKRQFVGTGIEFTHCVVLGDSVLVGGTVQPKTVQLAPRNGNTNAYTEQKASVDIVVVKLDKGNGVTQFIRQIDSHRDDQLVNMELSSSQGDRAVYLTANAWDLESNAGDSSNGNGDGGITNSLYVLSIDETGDHDWYNIEPTIDPITGIDSSAPPPVTDNERNPQNSPTTSNGGINNDESANRSSNSSSSGSSETNNTTTTTLVIVIVVVPLVLLLLIAIVVGTRCREGVTKQNTSSSSASSAIAKQAMTENYEQQQQKQYPTIGIDTEGDFDDVESLASENKLH